MTAQGPIQVIKKSVESFLLISLELIAETHLTSICILHFKAFE